MTSPWTDFLAREGALVEDNSLRFADESRSNDEAVAVPLVHLGLIRSSGEDSAPFLHNLFSNDVKKLSADAVQWNSFNSPKGRMLASLLVWPQAGGHLIALSADLAPTCLNKLSMYVLRSKVKLGDACADTALIGVAGARAAQLLCDSGLPIPPSDMHQASSGELRCIRLTPECFILAVPAHDAELRYQALLGAGARRAGTPAWQLAMIRAGLPLITLPTQEKFVAQMVNFDLIGGVNFSKGCYPGQEIVARTRYLGKLKKRMYRVYIDVGRTPRAGTDLFTSEFADQSVGKIVNAVAAPGGGVEALAVMQISCAGSAQVHLESLDGPRLNLLELPYDLPEATEESA